MAVFSTVNSAPSATDLAIVDSISSAHLFLREGQSRTHQFHVVSLHPVVQEYLREHAIACTDISEYVDDVTFERNLQKAEHSILALVNDLDKADAAQLSRCLGITEPIEWFSSLYRHMGRYELGGILNGICAFQRMLELLRPRAIVCFGVSTFSILKPVRNLQTLLEAVFEINPTLHCPITCSTSTSEVGATRRGLKASVVALISIAYELRNFIACRSGKHINVLLENLYDLRFLRRSGIRGAVVWPNDSIPWIIRSLDKNARQRLESLVQYACTLDLSRQYHRQTTIEALAANILINRIQDDLVRNIRQYGSTLLSAQRLRAMAKIDKLIWGADPNVGSKALLVEYFLKTEIKVIGSLHGNGYGTHVGNEQNQSAHSRCAVFLSYGYSSEDVAQTSTDFDTINAKIIPTGSFKIFKAAAIEKKRVRSLNKRRHRIDLFYPVTNNYSLFLSSGRAKSDTFLRLQRALLKTLSARGTSSNIVIKLPPNSVDAPTALAGEVQRTRTLKTTNHNVLRLMQENDVGAVLIDANFSMCLLELMPFDCEMFVLHDPVVPLSDGALALLTRRVHYLYSADQFDTVFDAYLNGSLERKRDASFMEKYLFAYSNDVERNVLNAIDSA